MCGQLQRDADIVTRATIMAGARMVAGVFHLRPLSDQEHHEELVNVKGYKHRNLTSSYSAFLRETPRFVDQTIILLLNLAP